MPDWSAVASLLRAADWAGTPLGALETWPERLRVAVELVLGSGHPMAVLWGPELRLFYNDAYARLLGGRHPAALGRPFAAVWTEVWPLVEPMFRSVLETGAPVSHQDLRLDVSRGGRLEEAYFTFSCGAVCGDAGAIDGVFLAVTETTASVLRERRLRVLGEVVEVRLEEPDLEESLLRSLEPLSQLPEDVPSAVVYLSSPGARNAWRIAAVGADGEANPHVIEVAGAIAKALEGAVESLPWPPAAAAEAQGEALVVPIPPRQDVRGVLIVRRPPGRAVDAAYLDFLTRIARLLSAAIARSWSVARMEQQRIGVLERMTDAFCAFDREGRCVYLNGAATRLAGRRRDEYIGRSLLEVFPALRGSVFESEYRRAVDRQRPVHFDTRSQAGDATLEVHLYPSPDGVSLFIRDVTEREALQAKLRQAQKMEAVGQLAGGIAHDFNNLLSVIGTFTHFALDSLPAGTQAHADVREVDQAVRRGAALTRQLLAFSRRQELVLVRLELNDVVAGVETMIRRLLREDIALRTALAPGLPPIHADRGQLEQALINLVINARDAMPQGGTITVETGRAPGADGERHAQLIVRDTGAGMDEATRARVFEPFFTTKPAGVGTGLGLAMVYGLVRQLGGRVGVESAPGRGTAFTLLLPWSADGGRERTSEPAAAGDPGGGETILLVEDDDAVRRSLRRLLDRAGYRVLEAGNGAEAVALLEQKHPEVQLVLTDVVMPVMDGRALGQRVRERWPALRLLFISGYDPEGSAVPGEVVPKPVVREELLLRIRQVLA